jgi:hypothetical protein
VIVKTKVAISYNGSVFLTYMEGLHLLFKLPPGPLNGLVGAGLLGQGLVCVRKLRIRICWLGVRIFCCNLFNYLLLNSAATPVCLLQECSRLLQSILNIDGHK